MTHHGTESDFELTTLQRLERLVYGLVFGKEHDALASIRDALLPRLLGGEVRVKG